MTLKLLRALLEEQWRHFLVLVQGAGCREYAVKMRKGWSRFTHFAALHIS